MLYPDEMRRADGDDYLAFVCKYEKCQKYRGECALVRAPRMVRAGWGRRGWRSATAAVAPRAPGSACRLAGYLLGPGPRKRCFPGPPTNVARPAACCSCDKSGRLARVPSRPW